MVNQLDIETQKIAAVHERRRAPTGIPNVRDG